ncbi:MAG: glycosyltransferase [Candidatus Riflebacteria bacterium]|nr:glycosyltransferase [Candidatus Riflebacteria bacterium]
MTDLPLKSSLKPLVTVVTVVFNDESDIAETIESVISQSFSDREYIILDGDSTDSTCKIINKYAGKIDYFTSKPDKGIYDAMNKAIKIARGRWIIFMNSGDRFFSDDILEMVFQMKIGEDVTFIYGNHQIDYGKYLKDAYAGLVENLWKGLPFSHQAVFGLTEWHKKRFFEIKYRFGADFNFFASSFSEGKKFQHVDFPISIIKAGGFSGRNAIISILERWKISRRYFRSSKVDFFYALFLVNNIVSEIAKKSLGPKVTEFIRKRKNWLNI